MKEIQGTTRTVQCVCIPIKDNHIFVSERGGLYLDLQATPLKEMRYGQSHLVKPVVGKDNWKSMSVEERNAIPIVGSLNPMEFVSEEDKNKNAQDVYVNNNAEDDGMPF